MKQAENKVPALYDVAENSEALAEAMTKTADSINASGASGVTGTLDALNSGFSNVSRAVFALSEDVSGMTDSTGALNGDLSSLNPDFEKLSDALSELTKLFIGITNESGDESAPPLSGSLGDEADAVNGLSETDSSLVIAVEGVTGDSRNLLTSVSEDTGTVSGLAAISKASSKLSEAINDKASEFDDGSSLNDGNIYSVIDSFANLAQSKSDLSKAFDGQNV